MSLAPCADHALARAAGLPGSSGGSAGNDRQIRRTARGGGALDVDLAAVVGFLRRRHPVATAAAVAVETGVSAGTVENWLSAKSGLSGRAFAALAWHYGPDFLAAAWEGCPWWLDAARRDAERARIDREIADLVERRRQLGD
mgnify:CR=1 FL=1